ncbi:kallikrein-7-like [Antechinus flavipes]|uniref:kallikrein-7-like n=1 Tax=Antechinus flavipes TaxID=38775 RepID=UPI002235A734|nr:kallikrein-7-like [Antechinus flavipes]
MAPNLWQLQLLMLAVVPWAQESEPEAKEQISTAGKNCTRSEHPWHAVLLNGSHPYCSGVLLDRNWVVTAAHCYLRKYNVYLGKRHFKKERRVVKIKAYRSYLHPEYSPDTHTNDIMLIKLSKPFPLGNQIEPANLPTKCVSPGTTCTVSGWGITSSPKETYPDKIQCTDVNVLSTSDCKKIYQDKIQDSMLCAALPNSTVNACNGDTGGPLICDKSLQGLVSWGGSTCGQPNEPGVYTNFCRFLPWVTKIMKN